MFFYLPLDYVRIYHLKTLRPYFYRVAQKLVNLKYSLTLVRIFRFRLTSQFVEGYNKDANCAMNVEDLISIFL
jgi:hypothetical protein